MKTGWRLATVLLAIGAIGLDLGCTPPQLLGKGFVGRVGVYDYSPSILHTGPLKQFWWCGGGKNPNLHSQFSDTILYESVNTVTGAVYGPTIVLAETPGAWDSAYTCNPKVIGGTFSNPLGDGQTYAYAMYYVGTSALNGTNNSIGVAFSTDGITWNKYPHPVLVSGPPRGDYGVAQPAAYNRDGKSGIMIFYEDTYPVWHHVGATSTDGVHFSTIGSLTTNGLDPDFYNTGDGPEASWGDMAYDPKTTYWYAAWNRQLRSPSTTGGVTEPGQLGVEIFRILDSSLYNGATPWEQLATIDTNLDGYESNFIAGFVRDANGNLDPSSYPAVDMYVSVAHPEPSWDAAPKEAGESGAPRNWDLWLTEWSPATPPMPLYRYSNGKVHQVTTGWVSDSGNFKEESLLGHLYPNPQQGATVSLYGCKNGSSDYFLSLDVYCEGKRMLGRNGYAYAHQNSGASLVPLYRCSTGSDHFVSNDPKCEGSTTDELLGYALP